MKRIILFMLLANINLNAGWNEQWQQAILASREYNIQGAEKLLSSAIEEIEKTNTSPPPKIYIDRARMYMCLNRYQDALNDTIIALKCPDLLNVQYTRAMETQFYAKEKLGIDITEDVKKYYASLPEPEVTVHEDHVYIKNPIKNDGFKIPICAYYMSIGYCKSEKDLIELDNGDWIIKKSQDSECQCPLLNNSP